jgi:hypothetical protein
MDDQKKMIMAAIGLEAVFSFCFMISSFTVAGTANMGFNVVITGFLYIAHTAGAYYVLKRNPSPLTVGMLIGATMFFTFLSLMTAIYWGQLSGCDTKYDGDIDHYSCSNKSGMRAVCAFATLNFLVQGPMTVLLTLRRHELSSNDGSIGGGSAGYDDLGGNGSSTPYSGPYDTSGYGNSSYDRPTSGYGPKGSSADL